MGGGDGLGVLAVTALAAGTSFDTAGTSLRSCPSGRGEGWRPGSEGTTISQVQGRPARPGDATAIAVVHVRSWQAASRGLVPQRYLDSLDPAQHKALWDTVLAESAWPRGTILVLEDQALVAGFCSPVPYPGPGQRSGAGGRDHRYLPPAPSLGDQRGQAAHHRGAPDTLAGAGYRQATLRVLDANQRARRFYQAGGWRADRTVNTHDTRRYRRQLP